MPLAEALTGVAGATIGVVIVFVGDQPEAPASFAA